MRHIKCEIVFRINSKVEFYGASLAQISILHCLLSPSTGVKHMQILSFNFLDFWNISKKKSNIDQSTMKVRWKCKNIKWKDFYQTSFFCFYWNRITIWFVKGKITARNHNASRNYSFMKWTLAIIKKWYCDNRFYLFHFQIKQITTQKISNARWWMIGTFSKISHIFYFLNRRSKNKKRP